MPDKNFKTIEHTADIGIRAYGDTREQLFENCAVGMMSIILGTDYVNSIVSNGDTNSHFNPFKENIEVDGDDDEDLLYGFLSDVLYLFEAEDFIPLRFNDSIIKSGIFRTSISGVKYDPRIFNILKEVKAVTFHRMKIERKGNKWQTDVIFDV